MYQGDWIRRLFGQRRTGVRDVLTGAPLADDATHDGTYDAAHRTTHDAAHEAAPARGLRSVPTVVWALGLTSFFTDISSEMVISILPAYLVLTGGLAPLLLGVATGLHEGGPILVAWLGGWAADRSGHRKHTAGAGYALSAICRLGWLLLPPQHAGTLAALVLSDRVGKAIRTAPRDALISLAARPAQLATAFGVHRALDAAGAALGPVLAFLLLWRYPQRFDIIFFAAFIVALLGVAALFLLVREPDARDSGAPHAVDASRNISSETPRRGPRGTTGVWTQTFALLRDPALRQLLLLGGAFGLVFIGNAFVYVLLVRHAEAASHWLPLFYSGTALMFLLFAVPLGALADRIGRARVYLLGQWPLALAYALACAPTSVATAAWPWNALLCVMLLGLFHAATDGVLASLVGARLPVAVRATGLASAATIVSLGRLVSALLFGLLWTRIGARPALLVALAMLVVLILAGRVMLRHTARHSAAASPHPSGSAS